MPNSRLLENAVAAIQLGVEDYQSSDPRRPFSAARNFFSGIVLLLKETLVAAAPNADRDTILAAKTKLVLDGSGGIKHVAFGTQTVDFSTLGTRLKDFGITINMSALAELNKMRNDIEHRYTTEPAAAVRQVIAKAFPIVLDLCRELGTTPSALLSDAWPTMIGVKDVYERELKKCKETFDKVKWMSAAMPTVVLACTECDGELVMQDDANNTNAEAITATCQACGNQCRGDELVAHSVAQKWGSEAYDAERGEASTPVHQCPYCAVDAYLTVDGFFACAWCGHEMGECGLCEDVLTPETVSFDNETLCCYCEYKINKGD